MTCHCKQIAGTIELTDPGGSNHYQLTVWWRSETSEITTQLTGRGGGALYTLSNMQAKAHVPRMATSKEAAFLSICEWARSGLYKIVATEMAPNAAAR